MIWSWLSTKIRIQKEGPELKQSYWKKNLFDTESLDLLSMKVSSKNKSFH